MPDLIFSFLNKSFRKSKGADKGEFRGLIPRVIEKIFDRAATSPDDTEFIIKASYLEIYMERIRDLLDSTHQHVSFEPHFLLIMQSRLSVS